MKRTSAADSKRGSFQLTAGPEGEYTLTCGNRSMLLLDGRIAEVAGNAGKFLLLTLVIPFANCRDRARGVRLGLVRSRVTKALIEAGYGEVREPVRLAEA